MQKPQRGAHASERRGFRVTGVVQGVGFRWATCRTGESLGLTGTVRNRADGSVEVAAEGAAEALGRLESWLGHGPPGAWVDAVERIEPPTLPIPERGFRSV